MVGRIAMDQMVVDLGEPGLSDPALGYLGAPAILFVPVRTRPWKNGRMPRRPLTTKS